MVEVQTNKKALTDLFLNRGHLDNETGEDRLQAFGVLSGDLDATCQDIGGDSGRGWGGRAEEAEGEGGEDREGERAHCEWIMSVGGKESDLVWEETERERETESR